LRFYTVFSQNKRMVAWCKCRMILPIQHCLNYCPQWQFSRKKRVSKFSVLPTEVQVVYWSWHIWWSKYHDSISQWICLRGESGHRGRSRLTPHFISHQCTKLLLLILTIVCLPNVCLVREQCLKQNCYYPVCIMSMDIERSLCVCVIIFFEKIGNFLP